MAQAPIRVMLVDDHAIVRSGFRRLLEQTPGIVVAAEEASGEEAYQGFPACLPDVTVMDLSMPGIGGLETMRRILARHPEARILVYSMHESAAFATQAMRAGACGYVTKASVLLQRFGWRINYTLGSNSTKARIITHAKAKVW